jgi:hypothetical protein
MLFAGKTQTGDGNVGSETLFNPKQFRIAAENFLLGHRDRA